jgi:hypothetical protein
MCPPSDPSSAGPGSSTSDCTSLASSTPGCANPTRGDANCSAPGSPECPCTTTFGPCEVKLLPTPTATTGGDGMRPDGMRLLLEPTLRRLLTSSPAASPAKAHRAPGNATGSSTPRPLCGSRCGASFASFDPGQCSSRTWGTSAGWLLPQASLLDPCGERFSGTWPRSGSIVAGTAYPLVPSAPRTSVTGSSALLGTPTARDGRADGSQNVPSAGGRGTSLMKDLLPLLPTPNASLSNYGEDPEPWEARRQAAAERHGNNGLGTPLPIAIKMLLPTPHGFAKEGQARKPGPTGNELGHALTSLSTGAPTPPPSTDGRPSTGLRLSPSFVEWMMGTPVCGECGLGWTDPDCPHSVTAYTSTAPGSSGARSGSGCEPGSGRDA